MTAFGQGDLVITVKNQNLALVLSKDFYNSETGLVILCPVINGTHPGATHKDIIYNGKTYSVICEQIRTMDPAVRIIKKVNKVDASDLIDIIDIVQGLFDYYPHR